MPMRYLIYLAGLGLALCALPAQAQNSLGGKVVTTCGTPGAFPTTGRPSGFTVDVNGKLCTDAASGGGAATIADGADVTQGTTTDAACATDNGTCTEIALLKRANQRLTTAIASLTASSTAANQATEIASLATIATNTGSVLSGVSESHSAAAETNRVAKASAGSVVSISGSAVSGSYIMLFDATSAPVDGAVTPKKCWGPMSSAGPFSLSWGIGPVLTMATGITVVSSSTGCFTKTATNAAFLSVEYQ